MSRFRPHLVLAARPAGEGGVVPIRNAAANAAIAPARANGTQARETSWRDLVRRLTKQPARL